MNLTIKKNQIEFILNQGFKFSDIKTIDCKQGKTYSISSGYIIYVKQVPEKDTFNSGEYHYVIYHPKTDDLVYITQGYSSYQNNTYFSFHKFTNSLQWFDIIEQHKLITEKVKYERNKTQNDLAEIRRLKDKRNYERKVKRGFVKKPVVKGLYMQLSKDYSYTYDITGFNVEGMFNLLQPLLNKLDYIKYQNLPRKKKKLYKKLNYKNEQD